MSFSPSLRTVAAVALAVVALSGCVAVKNAAPAVTPAMASSADMTIRELEAGRRLYVNRCNGCHALYPVANYTAARWRSIVLDMADEAKLSSAEENSVIDYLVVARAALPDRD